jgi:spore germination protein KC
MKVQIRSSGEIIENTSKLDLNDPKIISYIQHELENELKESVQLTLNKVQKKFKSDIIGFGNSVFREYPAYWKNTLKARWDQEFPNVKVSIMPYVNINQTGLNTKPFIWSEQEFIQ